MGCKADRKITRVTDRIHGHHEVPRLVFTRKGQDPGDGQDAERQNRIVTEPVLTAEAPATTSEAVCNRDRDRFLLHPWSAGCALPGEDGHSGSG